MAIQNKGIDLGPGNLVTGNMGSIPGPRKSLEKETAIHSCILAWEIPWTEEPGGLQSMGLQKSWT